MKSKKILFDSEEQFAKFNKFAKLETIDMNISDRYPLNISDHQIERNEDV